MAHEFLVNYGPTANQWAVMYQLFRRMQKAGFWLRASSNGTTKVVSDDPSAHTVLLPVNTANVGTAASITAVEVHPYGYLMTLTGLTGLVSPTVTGGNSEGCFITVSGAATAASNGTWQTYEVLSATSAKVLVRTGTPVAGDANNGAISWQEKDPSPALVSSWAAYTFGGAMWWACFEGMQTIQLKFTAAVTGEFLRGETVTQATSNATGECVGVVWDPLTNVGWMVLMPRTGLFDATHVVTGSSSGATFTPTVMHTYRRQYVFSKGATSNNTSGSAWYYIFRDTAALQVAESYTTKAANANCTATVAPGGSTSAGNRQVSSATGGSSAFYVLQCANNTTYDGATALVHADGIYFNTAGTFSSANGRAQAGVANLMPRSGRSADGTWWLFHGNTAGAVAGGGVLMASLRVDAGEEGEVDLTCHFAHSVNTSTSQVTRIYTSNGQAANWTFRPEDISTSGNGWVQWWRTYNVADGSQTIPAATYSSPAMSYSSAGGMAALAANIMARNWGGTKRLYSHPAVVPPGFKEPVGFGYGLGGRFRWLYAVQQGAYYQTFEGRKYVCVQAYNSAVNYPGVIIGPWDQTSDPMQS
jgi:hypothetical protein